MFQVPHYTGSQGRAMGRRRDPLHWSSPRGSVLFVLNKICSQTPTACLSLSGCPRNVRCPLQPQGSWWLLATPAGLLGWVSEARVSWLPVTVSHAPVSPEPAPAGRPAGVRGGPCAWVLASLCCLLEPRRGGCCRLPAAACPCPTGASAPCPGDQQTLEDLGGSSGLLRSPHCWVGVGRG